MYLLLFLFLSTFWLMDVEDSDDVSVSCILLKYPSIFLKSKCLDYLSLIISNMYIKN